MDPARAGAAEEGERLVRSPAGDLRMRIRREGRASKTISRVSRGQVRTNGIRP